MARPRAFRRRKSHTRRRRSASARRRCDRRRRHLDPPPHPRIVSGSTRRADTADTRSRPPRRRTRGRSARDDGGMRVRASRDTRRRDRREPAPLRIESDSAGTGKEMGGGCR